MRNNPGLLLCAAISALAFPLAAQACSPLEAFFGCREASVTPAAHAHQSHVSAHSSTPTKHAKRKHSGTGKTEVADRQTPLPPPDGATYASVQHFAADQTLRSGDIVVTTGGFLVFHDGDERKFTALDTRHSSSRQTSLASLEKASRRPTAATWQSPSPLAEWSPAVSTKLVQNDSAVRTISFSASAYR
jgi:hypothetical protein